MSGPSSNANPLVASLPFSAVVKHNLYRAALGATDDDHDELAKWLEEQLLARTDASFNYVRNAARAIADGLFEVRT